MEHNAKTAEINEMFNVQSDEEIVMGDLDAINMSDVVNSQVNDVDFTDDENAERIPGLDALMHEMGIGKMAS